MILAEPWGREGAEVKYARKSDILRDMKQAREPKCGIRENKRGTSSKLVGSLEMRFEILGKAKNKFPPFCFRL